ncbi:MAG: RNA-directed polymerase [Thermoleophilia bacterium]|nr:RNA-directed polymerase [Thermoleophilia bacterium]
MRKRAARALDSRAKWVDQVALIVLDAYRHAPTDRPLELARFVEYSLEQVNERRRLPVKAPTIRKWRIPDIEMGPTRWPVPTINTVQELGDFLGIGIGDLHWLADPRSLERSAPESGMRNYHYIWLPRRGGVPRLIEAPKPWLKKLQRRVLRRILDEIPPHEAAHGFRAGHSPITHARRHVGTAVVLRFDLEDFFASVEAGRVYGIFRSAGYPERVAHTLTALCTNASSRHELSTLQRPQEPSLISRHHALRARLARPHLPQGAPTSPALANLAAFRLDCRLSALATSLGASYSRYADDIAISGGAHLITSSGSVRETVRKIIIEEDFRLNERKSQLMTRAGRQQLTGVVVNDHLNIPRAEYDRIKAVLHDAATRGPSVANRDGLDDFRAHLLGKVSWVESVNEVRGAKLRDKFDRVRW